MPLKEETVNEQVILTLSSDEEEETDIVNVKNVNSHKQDSSNQEIPPTPINSKEPIINSKFNIDNFIRRHANYPGSYFENSDKSLNFATFLSLQCRSLRIGSYKVAPHERILFAHKGIQIVVRPFVYGETNPVTLTIPFKNIIKILAHFGVGLQAIFLYLTPSGAQEIRKELKMLDKNYFYFDPCSHEESHRRITLLPEKIKTEQIHILKNILNFQLFDKNETKVSDMFEELSMKEANEILVRSSPSEMDLNKPTTCETLPLFVYPPPPAKGGITLTTDDYCCLGDEQFLNDVLIDFYMKWLHNNRLSKADQGRTYTLSSFFYRRLTAKPKKGSTTKDDTDKTPAQRRHDRVKSWTKTVDIFSKDFILIPINERAHWFLAVVCFPGLSGPVRMNDNRPVLENDAENPRKSDRCRKKFEMIPLIDDDEEFSDRDEAEGDDAEMEDYFESSSVDPPPNKRMKEDSSESNDAIKQPCILIFDSMPSRTRSNIVATLREYLAEEYLAKKNQVRRFDKWTMPGGRPRVPQQTNYSDCGIFTLQFAEHFFQEPINDFRLPIKMLEDWFDQRVVLGKREEIAILIRTLLGEYKPDHNVSLPSIQFAEKTTNQEEDKGCDSGGESKKPKKRISINLRNSFKDNVSINLDTTSNLRSVRIKKYNNGSDNKSDCDNDESTDTPVVGKYEKPEYIKHLQKLKTPLSNHEIRQLVNYSDSDDSDNEDIFFGSNRKFYDQSNDDTSLNDGADDQSNNDSCLYSGLGESPTANEDENKLRSKTKDTKTNINNKSSPRLTRTR